MTLTTANIITLTRIFLAPIFLVFALTETELGMTIAVVIFAVAAVTDWLDGAVARSYQEVTSHGAYLDPLADKILVLSAFVAFYMLNVMPLWMVLVIILRDFGTTVLRSIAEGKGLPLVTSWHAKVKTFSQMVFVTVTLVLLWGARSSNPELLATSQRILSSDAMYWAMLSLTVFTVWTFIEYLIANAMHLSSRPRLSLLIASVGGVGHLPIMPGTWGSLVVLLPALVLPQSTTTPITYGVVAAIFIVLSLWSIPHAQREWGKDPGAVVIDEAAGMSLMLADPLLHSSPWWLLVAFFVFRVYDVAKPFPINRINDGTSAFSVLADDLLAAVYGLVTLHLLFFVTQYLALYRL